MLLLRNNVFVVNASGLTCLYGQPFWEEILHVLLKNYPFLLENEKN